MGQRKIRLVPKELQFEQVQLAVAVRWMQGDLDVSTEHSRKSSGDAIYDINIDRDHGLF